MRDRADEHRRDTRGDAGDSMVLGHPETAITSGLGEFRAVHGLPQRGSVGLPVPGPGPVQQRQGDLHARLNTESVPDLPLVLLSRSRGRDHCTHRQRSRRHFTLVFHPIPIRGKSIGITGPRE